MKRHLLLFLSIFLLVNTSCRKKTDGQNNGGSTTGETLYTNGTIYTVNPSQPWADAMLVKNGKIIAIGKKEDIESQATEEVNIVDLNNKFVMPGIHDVHLHPLEAASENFKIILNDQETGS